MGDGKGPAKYVLRPFLVTRALVGLYSSPNLWQARRLVDFHSDCDDIMINELAHAARLTVTRMPFPRGFAKIDMLSTAVQSSARDL